MKGVTCKHDGKCLDAQSGIHCKEWENNKCDVYGTGSLSKVVAFKVSTSQAIDYTPIHRFQVTTPIQAGSMLEWDTAKSEVKFIGLSTNDA